MKKATQPKISVIVPVYNVEKYIEQCALSLINQTLKDIEIIFIDDCSNDDSVSIIGKYAAEDERIKIIKHKQNSGLSASRNTGIEHSVAKYLMFCDSDDFYEPTMCQEMLNAIEKSGADIAVCGTNIIYEADEYLKQSDDEYYHVKYTGTKKVSNNIINNSDVSAWNKIYKKNIFEKYNLRYPFGLKYEDAFLFKMYMLWAKNITFVNKKLYNYRRRSGSIMNNTFKKCDTSAIDHLKIAFEIFDYLNKYDKYTKNYNYFWEDIFVPYFNFAWNHTCKKFHNVICGIASEFVQKNYSGEHIKDLYTKRILNILNCGAKEQLKKYFFGTFKVKETIDRRTCYFIAIPVYKINFFKGYKKHYLFGIQYKIKPF